MADIPITKPLCLDETLQRIADKLEVFQGIVGAQGEQGPVGPQGEQGPIGRTGANGINGRDGSRILYGTQVDDEHLSDSSIAELGDYYLNNETYDMYVLKDVSLENGTIDWRKVPYIADTRIKGVVRKVTGYIDSNEIFINGLSDFDDKPAIYITLPVPANKINLDEDQYGKLGAAIWLYTSTIPADSELTVDIEMNDGTAQLLFRDATEDTVVKWEKVGTLRGPDWEQYESKVGCHTGTGDYVGDVLNNYMKTNAARSVASLASGSTSVVTVGAENGIAMGEKNTVTAQNGAAIAGSGNYVSGISALCFGGYNNKIAGKNAAVIAGGDNSVDTENAVVLGGVGCVSSIKNSVVIGRYNEDMSSLQDQPVFELGWGSNTIRSTRVVFQQSGSIGCKEVWNNGADYAEMFEWKDANESGEDRVGLFVTMEGDKIRIATPADRFVLGVVSANPSVLGNAPLNWAKKYQQDKFGRILTKEVKEPYTVREDGALVIKTRTVACPEVNPDYDPTQRYIPRQERPEWAAVGLIGRLVVRQDGTLTAGGCCVVGENGLATTAEEGYYVMSADADVATIIL